MPFNSAIIPLCKHVMAKVTLVPCSVNLTGKQDTVGHGEVTINNARIIFGKHFVNNTMTVPNTHYENMPI